jgi:hypothetical protein
MGGDMNIDLNPSTNPVMIGVLVLAIAGALGVYRIVLEAVKKK